MRSEEMKKNDAGVAVLKGAHYSSACPLARVDDPCVLDRTSEVGYMLCLALQIPVKSDDSNSKWKFWATFYVRTLRS